MDSLEISIPREKKEGHWLSTATPLNMPEGNIAFLRFKKRGTSAIVNGRVIGTVRRALSGEGWFGRLEGYVWHVLPGMGSYRFRDIPGDKQTHTPVKLFKTQLQAEKAIEKAWKSFIREV